MKIRNAGVSRRAFLKSFGVGAAGLALPTAAAAGQERIPGGHDGELATLLDLSKCIGCGECVSACRESNAHKFPEPKKPFPKMLGKARTEDWSERRDVEDRLTPYNWLTLQTAEVEYDGTAHEVHVPRRCMHCQNPPCAHLCPFGAASKLENGTTRIHDSFCMGGSKCQAVCPWGVPQRQSGVGLYLHMMPRLAGNGVMYKCDRCFQLVEQGDAPACISACPEDVQTIGPRHEIVAEARRLAEETGGFLYGLDENGGTNTIYLSPVPFEALDQAVFKGEGQPHLGPAADSMADETNLATATLLAPIAGIAAAALGLGSRLFGKKEDDDVA